MKYFTKHWYYNAKDSDTYVNTKKTYYEYYDQIKGNLPEKIIKYFHFHDAVVNGLHIEDNNLIIEFKDDFDFYEIVKLIFNKYEILKNENIGIDFFWLYDEMYLVDGKYEVHILFCDRDMVLKEMIIVANDINFVDNGKKHITQEDVKEYFRKTRKLREEIMRNKDDE